MLYGKEGFLIFAEFERYIVNEAGDGRKREDNFRINAALGKLGSITAMPQSYCVILGKSLKFFTGGHQLGAFHSLDALLSDLMKF